MVKHEQRIEPVKILKLLLWVILLFSLFYYSELLWNLRHDIASGYGDFIIFYTGAEILRAGMGESLYDYGLQKAFQDRFVVPIRVGPLPFNHPPFELLIFLPLSYLSYPIAYLVWTAINIILLLAMFWLLTPFIDKENRFLLGFMLASFYPIFITIVHGQDSILVTFLLVATFVALKYRRHTLAGILLGLGLFKPQLVLPMAAILTYKRDWKAVMGFFFVSIVLAIVTLGMVGWQGIKRFLWLVSQINQQHYTIAPANMANVRGFFESMVAGYSPKLSSMTIALISLGLVIWLLLKWRGPFQPDQPSFNLQFSLTILTTLMTSYHLYVHDLTLLIIPAFLGLGHVLSAGTVHITRLLHLCLAILFWFPMGYQILLRDEYFSWGIWLILAFASLVAAEIPRRQASHDERNFLGSV
jgi:hypothetical protein